MYVYNPLEIIEQRKWMRAARQIIFAWKSSNKCYFDFQHFALMWVSVSCYDVDEPIPINHAHILHIMSHKYIFKFILYS